MLGQYSPYTFTIALLDTADPASLLTLHLYMYCPIASVVSVVYDVVLSLLTVVQLLLSDLLSQEYSSVPTPIALHMKVILSPVGTSPPIGWCVITGEPTQQNLYTIDREYFVITKVAWAKCLMSFNFVNTQIFLTLEILLNKTFPCYAHMGNDQHGSIQNGTLQIGSGNPSLL